MLFGPAPRITLACLLLSISCLLLSIWGLGGTAYSQDQATLLHLPPAEARKGEDLLLAVKVEGDTIITGEIYYRSPGGPYSVIPLVYFEV